MFRELTAGAVAFGAITLTAPVAEATPFGDGCTATHGVLGSSMEGTLLHESCTWGRGAWVEYAETDTWPARPVPGSTQQSPPSVLKKGGPKSGPVTVIPGGATELMTWPTAVWINRFEPNIGITRCGND
ncbi:MAG: hypothetical protein QOD39_3085 [Mycobacterium sp.]|nr:hypothetical protein [Mycobacterium sp.]